jgi:hypothetical protein
MGQSSWRNAVRDMARAGRHHGGPSAAKASPSGSQARQVPNLNRSSLTSGQWKGASVPMACLSAARGIRKTGMNPLEPTGTKPGVAGRLRAPHGAPSPPLIRRRPGREPLRLQPVPGRRTRDRSSAAVLGEGAPVGEGLTLGGSRSQAHSACSASASSAATVVDTTARCSRASRDVYHGPQHGSRRSPDRWFRRYRRG